MKTTTDTRSQRKTTAPFGSGPAHQEIAARAEAIWLERGCPQGANDEIWLEAERQLRRGAGVALGGLRREGFKSDSVLADLDELYPSPSGRETTSL
jgi:Protein of unknown function (DUF2934)